MIDPSGLPEDPGCYLFKDAADNIIYVGKAKNLKKRVHSYFRRHERDPKTEVLVEKADSVDFIVTDSELEALILENTLIKRHQPRYNIDLKDAKSYAYIHITDEEFPRIRIARRLGGSGSFFGPFVTAKERDYILSVVKKTFKLRSCRRLPKRACLRYHIGSCSAPCIGKISSEEYRKQVARAQSHLRGNTSELIRSLSQEMAEKSMEQEFEFAMELRDQIAAIEHLSERQYVDRQKNYDEDVINYVKSDGKVYLMLFNVYKGMLAEKQEFVFDEREEVIDEFLVQYYSEHDPPPELILPSQISDVIPDFLAERSGRRVRITVPKRGEKKKLLELVGKNIEISFFGGQVKLEALKDLLGLSRVPSVIECFDISHISGTSMVASMVQYRSGNPDKRNYRRFKIKTVEKIDDFAAIAEVVRRRYSRLKREDREFPDLIIIDGGKGQLSAARGEIKRLGLMIPIISIAKREEEIYVPGLTHPLPADRTDKASLLVQEIRDEAHRFAVAYHRLLRRKAVVS
ncbi:MAG: excinuclease ABC subunit C [Candidatus Methanogaster sp.]|uniref:Excinuclease ABC subunit C n=1 Tax=Candidatus Methanogaster sp. TaxID=3386292 RepID=A0AC61KXU0_9EURY|nr:MAG: excinuclease ABC subunit C [ANME-2 cluster archaeon]